MQITITGRHIEVTQALKDYIEEKLERLDKKYFLKIVESHVILDVEKYRQFAEIIIVGKHLRLTGKEETGDLYTSVDNALAKIAGQLKKFKDKLKEHKLSRQSPARLPSAGR